MGSAAFDVMIIAGEKDYNKIRYVYDSVTRYVRNHDKIYIVTPTEIERTFDAIYVNDRDVLDIDRSAIHYRPNWIYQQYIKLFQDITQHDDYLTVDCDLIFNKPIDIYQDNKPAFFFGRYQNYDFYFEYTEKMLGFRKLCQHSFINEFMLFRKSVIRSMLELYNFDKLLFIEKSNSIISENCRLSEFETYGNFVYKNFPDSYNYRTLASKTMGKAGAWENREIERIVQAMSNTIFDIFTIHTWS
jgi:hypothetical protein